MVAEGLGAHSFAQAFKWAWLSIAQFSTNKAADEPKEAGLKKRVVEKKYVRVTTEGAENRSLSWEEVQERNSMEECWVVIRGKVYDVTEFGRVHPGGKVIFTHGGRDATEAFTSFHTKESWSLLKAFLVGNLKQEGQGKGYSGGSSAILEDFRKLRSEFIKRGLFEASKMFYAYKLLANIAILASAVGVLLTAGAGLWGMVLSAFLLGLFMQQCGWLAHDFLHHQVFNNRWANNAFGYLIGNVFQGFSVDWWKSKHNTHHAVPNELDDTMGAMDPDIDTLPLLAWSTDMLDGVSDVAHRAIIRVQHYLLFPVLILARLSWAQQSLFHAFKITNSKPAAGWVEFVLILLHYGWSFGLAFVALPPLKAVLYLVLAQFLSGFMLSMSFIQSHNGMEVYSDSKDFVTAQVVSTRDIAYNAWVDWFMGGLNYQIEHHLFPSMPRHNLGKIQPSIKALCRKHGLPYEECDMVTGTKRVLERLFEVAKQA